ncbi:MAG: hypothetical protein KAH86_01585 [Methanosarcinales archaeon]|nr:hypothetical protein [Methanosarcinales archaeon]
MPNDKKIDSTTPKPFIFVLMPFDSKFDDIYKYGIKGAAEDVGAYAERVDEQIYSDGILERIFNQISKADVIVADMSDRNSNVFYEVGYAHALGKNVLLLTQKADDIPFDLRNKAHTVYEGKIDKLRRDLIRKLNWAISESKREKNQIFKQFALTISGTEIPENHDYDNVPVISHIEKEFITISCDIFNNSPLTIPDISYIYLFTSEKSKLLPIAWHTKSLLNKNAGARVDGLVSIKKTGNSRGPFLQNEARFLIPIPATYSDIFTNQFRLNAMIPSLPPGAVEQFNFDVAPTEKQEEDTLLMIRVHSPNNYSDFPFKIRLVKEDKDGIETKDLDQ